MTNFTEYKKAFIEDKEYLKNLDYFVIHYEGLQRNRISRKKKENKY